eukprot:4630186-Amphidinium_carterae.1
MALIFSGTAAGSCIRLAAFTEFTFQVAYSVSHLAESLAFGGTVSLAPFEDPAQQDDCSAQFGTGNVFVPHTENIWKTKYILPTAK